MSPTIFASLENSVCSALELGCSRFFQVSTQPVKFKLSSFGYITHEHALLGRGRLRLVNPIYVELSVALKSDGDGEIKMFLVYLSSKLRNGLS